MNRDLNLNYSSLVSVIYFSYSPIISQVKPLELRVGICEIRNLSLPEADRSRAIHEVNVDVIKIINSLARCPEALLLKSLRPSAILTFALLRLVSFKNKVTDLNSNGVFFFTRKGYTLTYVSDNLIVLVGVGTSCECLLFEFRIKVTNLHFRVLCIFAAEVH